MARDARQDGMTAELSGFAWTPDRFNPRVRATASMPRAGASPPDVISLAYGMPDPALFPTAGLAAAAEEALRDPARYAVALQYGNVGGNPLLLSELGRKLEAEEGRPVEPGSLVMTNGSSQAIALVVQTLSSPGDVCLSEAPTFLGTIHHIRFQGVRTVPVPLDDDGLDVEALEAEVQRLEAAGTPPRFIYTIPTFNNPAGVTMTLERRRALVVPHRRLGATVVTHGQVVVAHLDVIQR